MTTDTGIDMTHPAIAEALKDGLLKRHLEDEERGPALAKVLLRIDNYNNEMGRAHESWQNIDINGAWCQEILITVRRKVMTREKLAKELGIKPVIFTNYLEALTHAKLVEVDKVWRNGKMTEHVKPAGLKI